MNIAADVLLETHALLDRVTARDLPPDAALEELVTLRAHHANMRIDLVWDDEAFDGSRSYTALLRAGDGATISLRCVAPPALPWLARGAVRSDDRHLLAVNGTLLSVDRALACLDFIWDQPQLLGHLVDCCLVTEALRREPITINDCERRATLNAFRRHRGLLTAEATRRWMAERNLSDDALRRLVEDLATLAALRRRIAAGRVETWFADHHDELDAVVAVWCDWRDPHPTGVEDLLTRRQPGDRLAAGRLVRGDSSPTWGPVFDAPVGSVVRIDDEQVSVAVLIVDREVATLNDATGAAVERRLFGTWLAEQRATATIEWFWGDAGRTVGVV